MFPLPLYGHRSLAEVLPALLRALGLPEPASDLVVEPARAAALLLIDGLGRELLDAHAADAPYLSSMADAGPVTVGFPSSTSISLTSVGTGLPPGAHGVLGISFRVAGELLDSLKWTSHGAGEAVDLRESLVPEQVQPSPTAFERAEAAGIGVTVVSQRVFRGSGLTRAALRGGRFRGTHALGDLAAEVLAALAGPGRRLCYGYHADLDAMGHLHGPGSLAWRMQLAQVDRLVQRIAEDLPPGAVLAVTGDHGMVAVDRIHDADTDDALRQGVLLLGGDARARHVYARPGAADEVLAAWRAVLRDDAWVVPGEQAVADGWFGPVAPAMRGRVGDVVVAARGTAAVVRSEAEPLISRMPGQHGSLTTAEQLVPLLLSRS
ncbi:alkaline phosphatase family protein [Pseudonocardia sp. KRD-184]|uniref:Alkaline phosphatase family protein n=1 Tax=Pseudonocardia oceani TaxID=2792013 RepID=A0ABS6U7N3_9PSEU|nr:alkaline phosphatase family protein [Pseudonocardia oceani]MBW0088640.1 alkaline phosphatase family protein [Pseudonocardia oceani]MBW0095540.1 alkaline phosphatase family protein [Pseudonocardia oceani]MBW0111511.1 alkaline phosphatase family protein [Pseudonocardia oceani]MBW0121551.1 alkaline phosphatase family protein [Pseudonocardia oceani]MBW0128250.1 alkaline phosphatase family protein [Pseudonocardia oceani]